VQCVVAVRLTPSLRKEFHLLGGATWFRQFLAQSIEKRREAENPISLPVRIGETQ
jgi:hypothetical protein